MAEPINCPNCQRKLNVPEQFFGQQVQCPECGHQFVAAGTSASAEPLPPTPASDDYDRPRRRPRDEYDDDDDDDFRVRRRRIPEGEVPNYLVQSIVITLFCCWPVGIAAIMNAAKVNTLLASGDYEGAVQASEAAKKWCWVSFTLGLIATPILIALQLMADRGRF